MMCFFLYWLILLSTAFLSPQTIRWVFTFKAIIVPPAWAAIFVWAVVKVPISSGLIAQRSALSGSALSYAWLGAMNSALGSYASMAVNIQDFTVSATYLDPRVCFDRTSSGMLRTNKRKDLAISTAYHLFLYVRFQAIRSIIHNTGCFHLSLLHWYHRDICRVSPVRRGALESTPAHRSLGQPSCYFLCRVHIRIRYPWDHSFRHHPICCERSDGHMPEVH